MVFGYGEIIGLRVYMIRKITLTDSNAYGKSYGGNDSHLA